MKFHLAPLRGAVSPTPRCARETRRARSARQKNAAPHRPEIIPLQRPPEALKGIMPVARERGVSNSRPLLLD